MKVALIVQRYGAEVVGGSESLARQYARLLSDSCEVEVITTCAIEHRTWANHYPAGVTELDGIPVRRFATDFDRGPHWEELYRLLLGPMDVTAFPGSVQEKQTHAARLAAWPNALQEETIRRQGPYSKAMVDYLRARALDYDVYLFFTYLFPTTYFGMQCVPADRIVFCPTLHDEPIAYLPILRRLFEVPRCTIFLTESERRLARRLYNFAGPSEVVGMALDEPKAIGPLPATTPANYILYAGRIEGSKGTDTLLEYFLSYKEQHPSDLKLVLIGSKGGPIPDHPDINYLGFVTEAEKFALMKEARLLVQPSPYESFSIVLLESFLMGTPALVNGHNEVLVEHAVSSKAGVCYCSKREFIRELHQLLTDASLTRFMGTTATEYVKRGFLTHCTRSKLLRTLGAEMTEPLWPRAIVSRS